MGITTTPAGLRPTTTTSASSTPASSTPASSTPASATATTEGVRAASALQQLADSLGEDLGDGLARFSDTPTTRPPTAPITGGMSPLGARLLSSSGAPIEADATTSTSALQQRLTALQGQIADTRTRIADVQQELTGLEAVVGVKRAKVDDLLRQKTALEKDIKDAKEKQNNTTLAGALIAMMTGGNIATGAAVGSVVGTYTSNLASIEQELATNQAETAAIQQALGRFDQTQNALKQELAGLQGEEQQIDAALTTLRAGADPASILPQEVATTTTLHENLQRQLKVLLNLRDNARGFSHGLDGLIQQLEVRITELEAQKAAAEDALAESVADLVMKLGNFPPTFDVGGLSLDTKTALISVDVALKQAFLDTVDAHFAHLPTPLRDRLVDLFAARL